jgi:hypothetical protein
VTSSRAIVQEGDAPYVSGKRIDLSAATGIGAGTPLNTNVTDEPVYQYTTGSVDNSGGSPVVNFLTYTPSNLISLAPGDRVKLSPTYSNGGTPDAVYEYKGDPAKLNLGTQNYNSADWELVVHRPSLEAETTQGKIRISEVFGDLPIDRVVSHSAGDVTLSSQDGIMIGRDMGGSLRRACGRRDPHPVGRRQHRDRQRSPDARIRQPPEGPGDDSCRRRGLYQGKER